MLSKITIEVDFENGNEPVIQIISRESDDVRDNLIKAFLSKFGYSGNWCRIDWVQNHAPNGSTEFQRIFIRPIAPQNLIAVANEVIERAKAVKPD